MGRKCIYNRRTYTMQTTGNFVSATAEFSAGMQDRKHDFYRRNTCFVVDSDRNASSIINDCYGIIFVYRYLDGITVPRKELHQLHRRRRRGALLGDIFGEGHGQLAVHGGIGHNGGAPGHVFHTLKQIALPGGPMENGPHSGSRHGPGPRWGRSLTASM